MSGLTRNKYKKVVINSNVNNGNAWSDRSRFSNLGSRQVDEVAASYRSYLDKPADCKPSLIKKQWEIADESVRHAREGLPPSEMIKRREPSPISHLTASSKILTYTNLQALSKQNISASPAIDFAASVELGRRHAMSDRGIEAAASAVAAFHAAPATSYRLPYPWPPPPDEALFVAAAHFSQVRPQPAAPDPQHRAAAAPEPPVAGGLILPLPLGYPDRPLPPLPPLDGLGLLARPWPASPLPPRLCPPPRPAFRDVYPSPCYAAPYFLGLLARPSPACRRGHFPGPGVGGPTLPALLLAAGPGGAGSLQRAVAPLPPLRNSF